MLGSASYVIKYTWNPMRLIKILVIPPTILWQLAGLYSASPPLGRWVTTVGIFGPDDRHRLRRSAAAPGRPTRSEWGARSWSDCLTDIQADKWAGSFRWEWSAPATRAHCAIVTVLKRTEFQALGYCSGPVNERETQEARQRESRCQTE